MLRFYVCHETIAVIFLYYHTRSSFSNLAVSIIVREFALEHLRGLSADNSVENQLSRIFALLLVKWLINLILISNRLGCLTFLQMVIRESLPEQLLLILINVRIIIGESLVNQHLSIVLRLFSCSNLIVIIRELRRLFRICRLLK